MRSLLTIFIATLLFSSCGTAKKANTSAYRKPETKLILPPQPVATPANTSFVYDNERLFSLSEAKKLDSLVRTFEKSNLISIKLVTVSDAAVNKENFDAYNKKMLEEWSLLHGNSDKCMVVGISKNLRQIHIDFGPFVEKLLSRAQAGQIIENHFKPWFRQEQYYQGAASGLNALMDGIRKNIRF